MTRWETMRKHGWRFSYEEGTEHVGVNHPQGGKQSVCDLRPSAWEVPGVNELGHAIADMLNGNRPKFVPDDQGGHLEFDGKVWRPE